MFGGNSFGAHGTIELPEGRFRIARLEALERQGFAIARLPYSLKILLENLLRREDGRTVRAEEIEALARWRPNAEGEQEIAFMPARVLLQDFTGVPAVVDLAAMRDAMLALGGDPESINPLQPVELVIDHSVQVDEYGSESALLINAQKEFERNRERYLFLRWGQKAFRNFRVVPPATGIVHQVNLEYLARVVFLEEAGEPPWAYPDTLVGTDSHTTMINGLGVLGWGVGGIEAEAAMLGQPVAMLIPSVVGFRLVGKLAPGATATDLVLTVTQMLRQRGVVGKFVEFYGPGLDELGIADRATLANMAPEYGATCGIFPVDQKTLDYLHFTGRSPEHVARVERYMKEQGLFRTPESPDPDFGDQLELDLGTVEPSLAGPRRPQDRVALSAVARGFEQELPKLAPWRAVVAADGPAAEKAVAVAAAPPKVTVEMKGARFELTDGSVVIAAITSCTNTSNPQVMLAAGLLARKARQKGLVSKPWVKTSLAPGSKVVTEYLRASGLLADLEALRFHVVGYGCTTCIGNSGPLPEPVSRAIQEGNLVAVAVLSGNRNFEGRISPEVRANYLASPPLVVAYALAGRIDRDLTREPLGFDREGNPVFLRDVWPTPEEIAALEAAYLQPEMFRTQYADVFSGPPEWRALPVPEGKTYGWDPSSTYIRRPPYFEGFTEELPRFQEIEGARVLAWFGDSITTDHISPAGSIRKDSPAGRYLMEHGVSPLEFNSYGSRRGNHEVMVRGTFANIRLKNLLVPGTEGGVTRHFPTGKVGSIYDIAMQYREEGVPTLVLAGFEYGSGSSRDWAAKGPYLQGVRAVIARSFERIHRSNLVGMGIVPLEFMPGQSASSLGLNGTERYHLRGLRAAIEDGGQRGGRELEVEVEPDSGPTRRFLVRVRIDTPQEWEYVRHGGILPYVLRQLLGKGMKKL